MALKHPRHHLLFRQVHLDFHTSGLIPGIGEKFSKRQFQEALKVGQVQSITLFSKCHHGLSYHPTRVGRQHPGLKFDLLARQIDACREIGVRCPIYLSAGWDELAATEHPDWVLKPRNGVLYDPLFPLFKLMRWAPGYVDYLCAQIEEAAGRWRDADGIFIDIVHGIPDYSEDVLAGMKQAGLDPVNGRAVEAYAQDTLMDFYRRTIASCRQHRRDMPVYHNSGSTGIGAWRIWGVDSHLEIEALPTGGWGYDHFSRASRYAITTGMDFMGMTGKFHTNWGEFGGFKREAALRAECGAMLACGSKISIGDQGHPSGEMNMDTYRLIGAAFAEVARKQPWCDYVRPAARIAVVSMEQNQEWARGPDPTSTGDQGAVRALLDLHLPFVVLDERASWNDFEVIVLPDRLVCGPAIRRKAREFLRRGGRILAAGSALVDPESGGFAVKTGAKLLGRSANDPDYLVATPLTPDVAVKSPVMIQGGAYVIAPGRARVLVGRRQSYFNRTWDHFCSHQHTPDKPGTASPAAIVTSQVAYFAHDIFSHYQTYGQPLYRDFIAAALRTLLPEGLPAETTLPAAGRFNLLEQRAQRRYVAHLSYAPIRPGGSFMGQGIHIIEDTIPLRNVRVRVRLPRKIREVKLVPDGGSLPFTQSRGAVTFVVPEFTAHQMVELSYGARECP